MCTKKERQKKRLRSVVTVETKNKTRSRIEQRKKRLEVEGKKHKCIKGRKMRNKFICIAAYCQSPAAFLIGDRAIQERSSKAKKNVYPKKIRLTFGGW